MGKGANVLARGARVVERDAEWLVMWGRFTIPPQPARLHRDPAHPLPYPTNQVPFHDSDNAVISIDTLKPDGIEVNT